MNRDDQRQAHAQHEWDSLTKYPSFKADPVRFKAVLKVMFEQDPIRICMQDNPGRETEYSSEANAVMLELPTAGNVEDVDSILLAVFARFFTKRIAERMVNRERLAEEVWRVWNDPS